MKNRIVKVIGMVIVCSMFALPVFAEDPAPIGASMDSRAFLFLMPLTNPYLGSATIIYDGTSDVKKTEVSTIPLATWNNDTKQMEGTYMFSNWNQLWDDANNPDPDSFGIYDPDAWCYFYFALNGESVVITTYTYDDNEIQTDKVTVTEFILFRVQYAGLGLGNSDYANCRDFDITILEYN